ncbi:hypothetical protein BDC45DRAFT_574047 [Circinella umbellata]|nr:hypothetical protein BDC45DRAFT_574047 [Circinella umbellata]
MPSESQKEDICIVSSNVTTPTPGSSDMLSAAFQKQAKVVDTNNSISGNSNNLVPSPTTPTHRINRKHDPSRLRPSQLATMLKDNRYQAETTTSPFARRNSASSHGDQPLMIDVRDYERYEEQHIRNSININLPTLLIKRYRRGTVSNFNLESFIATEEGKEYYLSWLRKSSSLSITNASPIVTAATAAARRIIIYDDTMQDLDSHAWILVNVMKAKLQQQQFRIYTLDGGFDAFVKWDTWGSYLIGSMYNNNSLLPPNSSSTASSSSWAPWEGAPGEPGSKPHDNNANLSVIPATPTQSRSATTFSSSGSSAWINPIDTNVQRRASLFSLDTSTAREKFHNRQQRYRGNKEPHLKPSRSRGLMKSSGSSRTNITTIPGDNNNNSNNNFSTSNYSYHNSIQEQQYHDLSSISESSNINNSKEQQRSEKEDVEEDNYIITAPSGVVDSTLWSADTEDDDEHNGSSGTNEGNHEFIISEIVPGFLYLGPEISTQEQSFDLQTRSIKQILNMAEECNDDVPGLKDQITYHKVAAQDTVIMQNVEETLKRAVQVIDQAKNKHEPIYVHCKAGKSRSVAAILAYFVLSEKWTLKRAYQHVIKTRPSMSPNIGFVAELLKLEKGVHGQVSNFGYNWQSVDPSIPPSPESQKAIGKVESAWSSA